MYKGETLFYYLNLIAIFSFSIIGIIGLAGVFDLFSHEVIITLHYYLVFFVGIGYLILGSTLQFYKAMTGQKVYPPPLLKNYFIGLLIIGTLLIVFGTTLQNDVIVKIGLVLYLIAVLIHFYWISQLRFHKYFKFPLDYYYIAQIFQIIGISLLFFNVTDKVITHIFTLGWITLTLQGALIRIFPMFMGKSIDRSLKPTLSKHLIFSTLASVILLSGFAFDFIPGYAVGGILYLLSWLWVIYVLIKSISNKSRNLIHKPELLYFIPGIFWLLVGTLFSDFKSVHIHLTLFAGLFMIMIGAAHRILVFQAHSMVFTGRKSIMKESAFMQEKQKIIAGILLNIATLLINVGFYVKIVNQLNYSVFFISGGITAGLGLGIIYKILLKNHIIYLKEKKLLTVSKYH